jgi:hypothetical protein
MLARATQLTNDEWFLVTIVMTNKSLSWQKLSRVMLMLLLPLLLLLLWVALSGIEQAANPTKVL